jgi:hypothetical protein
MAARLPAGQENHMSHQTGMVRGHDSRYTIAKCMTSDYHWPTSEGSDDSCHIGGKVMQSNAL